MKIEKKFLKICNSIHGDKINVLYYILKGQNRKPTVYIQGGIHGGELTYFIFYELIKRLKKKRLLGNLILVPICNPFSWQQKFYFYVAGKFSFYNGKDFNRNFPGKKDGTLIERLVYKLTQLADLANFSIDLHTANRSKPFLIIPSLETTYLEIAKESQLPYIMYFDMEKLKKEDGGMPFTGAQIKKGQVSIAYECGSHDRFNRENIEEVVNSLLGILAHWNIVKEKPKANTKKDQYLVKKLKKYFAPTTGLVEYLLGFREKFKKGEPLYKIYPSSNLTKKIEVKAEEEGILFFWANTHIVREGDYVVEVALKNGIKRIK